MHASEAKKGPVNLPYIYPKWKERITEAALFGQSKLFHAVVFERTQETPEASIPDW